MAVFLDKLNRNFELLPEKLKPWRWWILGLYLLLMLFFGFRDSSLLLHLGQ